MIVDPPSSVGWRWRTRLGFHDEVFESKLHVAS